MPRTRADLDLSGEWCKTASAENFILANDGDDDKIVIFGTERALQHVSEADTFFVDGTFSVCPSIFYQVFTIHIMKYNQVFPMIYALLPNKQRHTYNRAFMLLKDAALDLGLTLDPISLMCDFELAIIQASLLNFPNASHRGCYYHYMQSIWRKVQSLGLADVYRSNDPTLKQFIQKMAAIAFCPPAFVRPAWLGVQQEAPQIPNVDSLVEYFDSTWVNGQFQFQQWNYFDFDGPRTHNHVEGWHSRLKKVVGKPHPNIFELIEVIKKEEVTTRMKMQQFESGAQEPPRRRKVRERERRIQLLFQRFNGGTISIDEYLESFKHHTGL